MRPLFLLCTFLIVFPATNFSQSCLPEGITFRTQAQIDSFQVNYPGCTKIGGSVHIFYDDISDLTGISMLDSIFGSLEFQNTDQISDMTGLSNLKFIEGGLYLISNEALVNLSGLENLRSIGGSLDLMNNPVLTSLTGLENITHVKSLNIELNDALTSLTGLEGLDSISQGLSLSWNFTLSNLDGLSNLVYISGGLHIEENSMLTSLSGLEGLTSIEGELSIFYNNSLTSLAGLENIYKASISSIWIYGNQNLSECNLQNICDYLSDPDGSINIYHNATGCENPHEIADNCGITLSCLPFGNYYFMSQADIDSFPSYYSSCNELDGWVEINGLDIINLDSLYMVDTISGSLNICGNNNLSDMNGLINLKSIQEYFYLGMPECGGNPSLTSLAGLNNLTSVGKSMIICYNSALDNLSGLESLSNVGNGMSIIDNAKLKNLEGANNLINAGSITVNGNDSLKSLSGLQSLINTNSITMRFNPMLKSLEGIENLNAELINYLSVEYNATLSECDVKSICEHLSNPQGIIEIDYNAYGCNSPEEVEAACLEGIEEDVSGQSKVVIYPNPTDGITHFAFHISKCQWITLKIYDLQGREVATILDEEHPAGNHQTRWNAEKLTSGIYFYRLSTNDYRPSAIGKIVLVR